MAIEAIHCRRAGGTYLKQKVKVFLLRDARCHFYENLLLCKWCDVVSGRFRVGAPWDNAPMAGQPIYHDERATPMRVTSTDTMPKCGRNTQV